MKSMRMGIMDGMEYQINSGFKPTLAIYLALGQDEENGRRQVAVKEMEYFKPQGLQFGAVMDESGFIIKDLLSGLPKTQWVNLVGAEEKVFLKLRFTAELEETGQSAIRPQQTSIGILAVAIDKLEQNQFPDHWLASITGLLDYVGPETSFPYNVIFANRWMFGPVLLQQFSTNSKSNAMIRTSTVPDVFNAGLTRNDYRGLLAKVPTEDLNGMHGSDEKILVTSFISTSSISIFN